MNLSSFCVFFITYAHTHTWGYIQFSLSGRNISITRNHIIVANNQSTEDGKYSQWRKLCGVSNISTSTVDKYRYTVLYTLIHTVLKPGEHLSILRNHITHFCTITFHWRSSLWRQIELRGVLRMGVTLWSLYSLYRPGVRCICVCVCL